MVYGKDPRVVTMLVSRVIYCNTYSFTMGTFVFGGVYFVCKLCGTILQGKSFVTIFQDPFGTFVVNIIKVGPCFGVGLYFTMVHFALGGLRVVLVVVKDKFTIFVGLGLLGGNVFLGPFVYHLGLNVRLLCLVLDKNVYHCRVLYFFGFKNMNLVDIKVVVFFFGDGTIVDICGLLGLVVINGGVCLTLNDGATIYHGNDSGTVTTMVGYRVTILICAYGLVIT